MTDTVIPSARPASSVNSTAQTAGARDTGPRIAPVILRGLLLAGCLLMAAGCRERARSEVLDCTLATADGLQLAAQCFQPLQQRPPGLILIHRQGATRAGWEPLARAAQQAGYLALSFDLRGHGESQRQRDGNLDHRTFTDVQWQDVLLDLRAAKERVLAAGADPDNLFVAGEALGASFALQFAVEDPEIQGVVMLSPGLDYQGIDTVALLQAFTERPVLLVWAGSDAYAATAASTLKRAASGHVEVHSYPGAAHGTNIFALSPHATGQILVWLGQMRLEPPAGP